MRYIGLTLFCIAGLWLAPDQAAATDENQEPPLQHFVDINGKTHSTVLGEKLTVQGTFTDPVLIIRAATTRKFTYGDIAFEYPAEYNWEAEIQGDSYRNWTISGNDFTIMYFRMAAPFTPEKFAESMLQKFGKAPLESAERTLGGTVLTGKKFTVAPGGHKIRNEALTVPVSSGSGLLVFQDTLDDGEAESPEARATLTLLAKSFQILTRRPAPR